MRRAAGKGGRGGGGGGGRRAFGGGGGYGGGGFSAGRGLSLGSLALGGALGAGVGAGLAIWWLEQKRAAATPEVEVVTARESGSDPLDHPALKFGMPVGSILRPFTNFVSYFDTR